MAEASMEKRGKMPVSADRVVQTRNPHVEIWLKLASKLGHEGRHEKAVEIFSKIISANPEIPEAWHCKGDCLEMLGKHDEAISCYDAALKHDPLNADTWFNKGLALKAVGREDEGTTCCNYAVSLYLGK